MTRNLNVCIGLCLITFSSFAVESNVPDSGAFGGLGGSYNSVKLEQDLYASGISNVYSSSILVADGTAGGPATPYVNSQSTFAPEAQVGYFKHFTNSNLLWGVKFFDEYLNSTTTDQAVNIPQDGAFTTTGSGGSNTFTGHVIISSIQTTVTHELALMPFIGRSFNDTFVYFGAGPTLSQVQYHLNDGTGYADVNGSHDDLTGTPASFSNSIWVWGEAVQVGMAYYFDPSFFLDFDYTYATEQYNITNTGPFNSTFGTYTSTGSLYVNNAQRMTVQGIVVSINKMF